MDAKERILNRNNLPGHVAIIMDGNGRWAKKRGLKRIDGHAEGVNSVREIVEASGELGIKVVTFYTFSTENWKRPKGEVSSLWKLLVKTIKDEVPELRSNNVQFRVTGIIDQLPKFTRQSIQYAINALQNNDGLILNLALNYSSRMEITNAVRKIAKKISQGLLDENDIDEKVISEHLFTSDLPDPDLVIRTSGELRISNFLLWQIAYSELYITNTLWPDFRRKEFYEAIESYQLRERRFGMISDQVHESEVVST
ncbi:isoprenyl transferase [candidate division KSB1 bacterium]|nr:isoprenyl transferase [candidate division KSB1 bacterium]